MRLIFRDGEPDAHRELSAAALSELYRHPDPGSGVWLRSNFVTSLDGSIQGTNGRSSGINTPSDKYVFALHRAHCDAVVVGAGTARAEGYRAVDLAPWQQRIRQEQALTQFPLLVVVSASLRLDPAMASAHTARHGEVLAVTTARATAEQAAPLVAAGMEILRCGDAEVDLARALDVLRQRGHQRLLCEGGPRLHRDLLAADLVDSLSLTLAPMVVGGVGARTTSGAAIATSPTFRLDHVLYADDGTLFTQYVRA